MSETSIKDYYYTDSSTGQKVTGVSKNYITDAEAAEYTIQNVMSGDKSDGESGYWNPTAIVEKTDVPVVSVNGNIAQWAADDFAICYVVTVNGKPVAFPTDSRYVGNEGDIVTVQSVNEYGALSTMSAAVTLGKASDVKAATATATAGIANGTYTLDGKKLSDTNATRIYITNGKKFTK